MVMHLPATQTNGSRGYCDYYPVTTVGRTGAVILMFFGLGIIGVLASYLSTLFISLGRTEAEEKGRRMTKAMMTKKTSKMKTILLVGMLNW